MDPSILISQRIEPATSATVVDHGRDSKIPQVVTHRLRGRLNCLPARGGVIHKLDALIVCAMDLGLAMEEIIWQ